MPRLSPSRFPLSAFRSRGGLRRARRAVTILEVLFAILVTTIGLLGAIAIFPVASAQARKGRQNDIVAVAADSIAHQFDTQYMRRPDQWFAWSTVPINGNPPGYYPVPLLLNSGAITPGLSYCIDPRFVSVNAGNPTTNAFVFFPAVPRLNAADVSEPRMLRINLRAFPAAASVMSRFQADQVFAIEDELVYERPGVNSVNSDNALPAFQNYNKILDVNSGNMVASRRQEAGDLTWMATVVPKLNRDSGIVTPTDLFTLSIVVFLKRSPDLLLDGRNTAASPSEHTATEQRGFVLGPHPFNGNSTVGDFHAAGIGGGEVTISVRTDVVTSPTDTNPYDNTNHDEVLTQLNRGSWVMLAQKTSNNTAFNGNCIYSWYRVSDAEETQRAVTIGGFAFLQRDVTLVGPDWQLLDLDNDGNADPAEVTIIPGVIAVYERTIRLEQDFTGL